MENNTFIMILEELRYIRGKVDKIEEKMVSKDECRSNMEDCPIVKKKNLI